MVTGFVLDCSTSLISMVMMVMMDGGDDDDECLVSDAAWIVLDCSTSLVLAVPRFGCCLDCS